VLDLAISNVDSVVLCSWPTTQYLGEVLKTGKDTPTSAEAAHHDGPIPPE
jgi:hypothetical protein